MSGEPVFVGTRVPLQNLIDYLAGYDVIVTPDRKLEYQQHIPRVGLAVVVLRAYTSRIADIAPLVSAPQVLPSLRAGTVTHVGVYQRVATGQRLSECSLRSLGCIRLQLNANRYSDWLGLTAGMPVITLYAQEELS